MHHMAAGNIMATAVIGGWMILMKKKMHIYFKMWYQGKLKLSSKFSSRFGFEYQIVWRLFSLCKLTSHLPGFSLYTVAAIETKAQRTVSNSLWCALLSKGTGGKCCVFFFKLRQRSRHFRLRHSRWLPENGKEFRKMKGKAACGLWKRDRNPRPNTALCICGAERSGVAEVCRSVPPCTFAGIILVLLQWAPHCKFDSKHKHCTSAGI